MNVLRKGSKGSDVTALQIALNKNLQPSPYLPIDGQFGLKVFAALKLFQIQEELGADGIAGKKTWSALGLMKIASVAPPVLASTNIFAPWLNIALAEKGVAEIKAKGVHNKKIIEYHSTTTLGAKTDEIPWCSSFVNWVMIAGGYKGTDNALAKSWASWGELVSTPFPGAITVIKRKNKNSDAATGSSTGYHVAFFVSLSSTQIRLLGGNQGDKVKESGFMLRSYEVVGYRKPLFKIIGIPLNSDPSMRYA